MESSVPKNNTTKSSDDLAVVEEAKRGIILEDIEELSCLLQGTLILIKNNENSVGGIQEGLESKLGKKISSLEKKIDWVKAELIIPTEKISRLEKEIAVVRKQCSGLVEQGIKQKKSLENEPKLKN